jgi:hypothetical protein
MDSGGIPYLSRIVPQMDVSGILKASGNAAELPDAFVRLCPGRYVGRLSELTDSVKEEILQMHIPRIHQGEKLYPSNTWLDNAACRDASHNR